MPRAGFKECGEEGPAARRAESSHGGVGSGRLALLDSAGAEAAARVGVGSGVPESGSRGPGKEGKWVRVNRTPGCGRHVRLPLGGAGALALFLDSWEHPGEGTRVENACLSPDPPSTSSHLWFEVPVSHVTSFSVHRAHFPFRKSGKEGS